jgi:hypothetical protein
MRSLDTETEVALKDDYEAIEREAKISAVNIALIASFVALITAGVGTATSLFAGGHVNLLAVLCVVASPAVTYTVVRSVVYRPLEADAAAKARHRRLIQVQMKLDQLIEDRERSSLIHHVSSEAASIRDEIRDLINHSNSTTFHS